MRFERILHIVTHTHLRFVSETDECACDPCHNDGVCLDSHNGYSCTCTAGFAGTQCDEGKVLGV